MPGIRFVSLAVAITIVSILTFSSGNAQTVADGSIRDGVYTNRFLHFSYAWPKGFIPRDPVSLQIHAVPNSHEALLFSAQQQDQPYGIVLLAEQLGIAAPHTSPIRDGSDFLNRVVHSWDSPARVLSRSRPTGPGGTVFEELDYVQADEWSAAITTQAGQWLLAFRCNARNAHDLEEMKKSVLALKAFPTK